MQLTKLGKIVVALGAACIILAGWKAFGAYKREKAMDNRTYKAVEHVKLSKEKEQEIEMNYTDESAVIDIVISNLMKCLDGADTLILMTRRNGKTKRKT